MRYEWEREYLHHKPDWPHFRWDMASLADQLAAVRNRQGRFLGRMESLGFQLRKEASLEALIEDVQKSSEIEGEHLDREQIRSSFAQRLGMDGGSLASTDRNVDGIVEMMLDATQHFDAPLTDTRLFDWHVSLVPNAAHGLRRIRTGVWRDDNGGPMRAVSGPIGHEKIHFEAPDATRVPDEMAALLAWFEGDTTNVPSVDPVLRAALAHLWFVTIHPFDDGNGRIARAVADMALARSEESPQRFYSMSGQIRKERKAYYDILESTQNGDMDVTPWMTWFLGCLDRAIEGAESLLGGVLTKARFWNTLEGVSLNDRQRPMLNRMLNGFDGKLTTVKWSKISKCSHDTALRDIHDLVGKGVLLKEEAGGRSTSYSLCFSGPVLT